MTKVIEKLNCINGSGPFQSEDAMHSRTSVRCSPSQTVIQWLILESKFVDLQVFRTNVGTLKGSSRRGKHRPVDICCLLETRLRGKSMRIISGKTAQYKLLWIGNEKGLGEVGIFLAKKWADKVINISRVSDRMIVNLRYFFKGLLFHWSLISLFILVNVA